MRLPGTNRSDLPATTHTNHALANPEVFERPRRRRFAAAYKLRIVQEADAAVEFRQVGALLRREGLYSSQLAAWRRSRDAGALSALGQPRGRKPADPAAADLARLQQENARLARRLAVAEEIIAVQKKVSALLGIVLEEPEPRSC
jgi:transposase-like protein